MKYSDLAKKYKEMNLSNPDENEISIMPYFEDIFGKE